MKKVLSVVLFMLLALPVMSYAREKIGVVNMQRVLQESERGKKLMEHLKEDKSVKEENLKLKQDEVKKLKSDYDRMKGMWSTAKRQEKESEIMKKMQDFQQQMQQYQAELQQKEAEYTNQALNEIKDVISKYGKKRGYSLMLEKTAVLYINGSADLTDAIINEYDKWYKSVKGTK